ncbi:MAG: UDP-N-acetylmuramate dehydrogenase [Thermoleophilaceae bacterium]|nr:UDP-N-acetylmuramate dehydrogenase [Thermoleophilaceae bacterium]
MSSPAGVERDFDLARLTTVRTGGEADFYARPSSNKAVVELLAWASSENLAVGVIGSGSNLLIADKGFRGLVIKLDGHLTEVHFEDDGVLSGGGARLPRLAAKTAEHALSGLEFGVNIPGTVGGAIRMNANAYGGELASVLEWAEVASPEGIERRVPEDFEFTYRHSNISGYQVVTRAQFRLTASTTEAVKAKLADLRDRRKAAQPAGIKTFGSTFKNPDDPRAAGRTAGQLLEAAGCKGLEQGGARFSPKHANFVENFKDATTSDIVALIAAGRERVEQQFGVRLETEVQVLGELDTALWESR